MTEYIDQAAFERLLAEEDGAAELNPVPVFLAPRTKDRGYWKRVETAMEFQVRIKNAQRDMAASAMAASKADAAGDATEYASAIADAKDALHALIAEMSEFVAPYIRAIKYPQADGTIKYWARPAGAGDDLMRYEADVKALLYDAPGDEFAAMMTAIMGGRPQDPNVTTA